jgi:hypothetical protein
MSRIQKMNVETLRKGGMLYVSFPSGNPCIDAVSVGQGYTMSVWRHDVNKRC